MIVPDSVNGVHSDPHKSVVIAAVNTRIVVAAFAADRVVAAAAVFLWLLWTETAALSTR